MNTEPKSKWNFKGLLTEDWLAVWISLLLILLTIIGLFGPNGINITF